MSDEALCSPALVTHHSLLECKGCLFFNNLEEVKATPWKVFVVWLGLDCMYRSLPLSSMAMGATQALK
jgi:hypothetical protein